MFHPQNAAYQCFFKDYLLMDCGVDEDVVINSNSFTGLVPNSFMFSDFIFLIEHIQAIAKHHERFFSWEFHNV